ncbi:MAG: hypothetical protein QW701_04600 [Candidatus Nezhaarchaeales archaeon]
MPRISNVLYSYCGIVCSFCKAFVNGDCGGCDRHTEACEYAKCCLNRSVKCCFECSEFPCRLHVEGFAWSTEELGTLNWKVYSRGFLNMFRPKKR